MATDGNSETVRRRDIAKTTYGLWRCSECEEPGRLQQALGYVTED
jgi:hypothetical protein